MNDISNGQSGFQTLFDIEITRWFVEHENVPLLDTDHRTGEALQFSSGQIFDLSIGDVGEVEEIGDFLLIAQFIFLAQQITDSALERRGERCRSTNFDGALLVLHVGSDPHIEV